MARKRSRPSDDQVRDDTAPPEQQSGEAGTTEPHELASDGSPSDDLPGVLRALRAADDTSLMAWLQNHERRSQQLLQTRRAYQQLREMNQALSEQLEVLAAPPRPVARLIEVDVESRRARVAVSPSSHVEIGVDGDVATEELVPGRDVVLASNRSVVLRVLPAASQRSATVRLLRLDQFLPARDGAVRQAVALEAGRSVVVRVPPEYEAALMETTGQEAQLLVDEHSEVVGIDLDTTRDPVAAAARFRHDLEPIDSDEICGLSEHKRSVESSVERLRSVGAFLLSEGPPGAGKTLLARYAVHCLQARGETIVLSLPPSAEHRWFMQLENDIRDLCLVAEGLAAEGRQVLVFLDEIDAHFYQSRFGHSTHTNSARATWLSLLGDGVRPGVLFYATTNKASHLPSEMLNRVTHPLSFLALRREDARSVLLQQLRRAVTTDPAQGPHQEPHREPMWESTWETLLDAAISMIYDRSPSTRVAEVTLRSQEVWPVYPHDLRQLSARFYVELARSIVEDAAGTRLQVERALAVTASRLAAVMASLQLTPENVAERSFLEFSSRNPPEEVRLLRPDSADRHLFRYEPMEV